MRRTSRNAGIVFLALGLMGAVPAGKQEAKLRDIQKLLVLTGSEAMGQQVMDQMIEALKPQSPGLPDKFWEDFKKEGQVGDLIQLIVPIYDKYLSAEDLKGLIAFYESPVGRKFISVQPQIVQESMAAGQEWGMQLGTKIGERLQAAGMSESQEGK